MGNVNTKNESKTLSTVAPAEIVQIVERIAEEEDRTTSQVVKKLLEESPRVKSQLRALKKVS